MINILVIIYRKTFWESKTLFEMTSICKSGILKEARLIIWDNSPLKIDETAFDVLKKHLNEVTIMHTPENLPLSKIYNKVIDSHIKPDDYLILLDHDTFVTQEYFTEIINKINTNDLIDLLLPQVVVNERFESPAYQYILFTKRWKDRSPGVYSSNNVTAINSGMVISGRFLSNGFKYDERLLFYGTDTYMMYKYSCLNKNFYLLNVSLKHDLNLLSNPSIEQKSNVFKAIKQANLIVYSSNYWYSILTRINNFVIAVKYTIKYKSLAFFK